MTAPNEDGIVFRTDAEPAARRAVRDRSPARIESYATLLRRVGAHVGVPGAAQGATGRRRRAPCGAEFMALTTPRVWPEKLEPDAIREIRAMKERAEEITERKGLAERELKRGRGGIRDIEFAVQLLQLVHGRDDESRAVTDHARRAARARATAATSTGPTPTASTARTGSSAPSSTASSSTTSSRPTLIPSDEHARIAPGTGARLPRRPGTHRARALRGRAPRAPTRGARHPRAPVLRAAPRDPRGHRRRCRPRRPRNASPRSASPTSSARAPRCASSPTGSPAAPASCSELLPVILEWLSETPDPDLGLLQLRRLAEGPARSASLATTFRDAPGRGRARVPPPRVQPGRRRRPAAPPGVRRHPRRRRRPRRSRHPRRARRRRASTRSSGAATRSSAVRGSAASSDASCCASRPATSSGTRALEDDRARARRCSPRRRLEAALGVAPARRSRSR